MKCDWCNQPIRKKRETVGNTNLHPDCLEEITELTILMFREKLDDGNPDGPRGGKQNRPRSARKNRNT